MGEITNHDKQLLWNNLLGIHQLLEEINKSLHRIEDELKDLKDKPL